MDKARSRDIMTRTQLRKNFLKDRNEENRKWYLKQHNYCVPLLRKSKSDYFGNLNEKNISDTKTFWKTIKPLFRIKNITNKVTIIDKEQIILTDYNTTKVLNTFFSNIVSNLNMAEYSDCEAPGTNVNGPVLKSVVKFRSHPSMRAIGELCNKHPRLPFYFSGINRE